jgi:hypothetical protein
MPKFTILASYTQDLEITIDADSLEHAREIAESDQLVTDDFDSVNGEFKITLIHPADEVADPALNCECGYQH